MDVQPVSGEVLSVADAVVGESLLPDFAAADFETDRSRVATLDELHGAFQGDVRSRCDEQVDVIGHQNKCVELELPLAAIAIESLQQEAGIRFDDKESSALESGECYEISSGRGYQSSRFHLYSPPAAEAGWHTQPNAVRLEVSPFPVGIFSKLPRLGTAKQKRQLWTVSAFAYVKGRPK